MEKPFDVSIIPCKSYDIDLEAVIEKALDEIGGFDYIKEGMTIGIKANLVSSMKPEKAGTTHPALISALCGVLVKKGVGKIIIGDSPGGLYNSLALSRVYSSTGMMALENDIVKMNDDYQTQIVDNPEGKALHSFTCTSWLSKVDVIINFCKLKTHGMMGMSCAVKNLFGTIPGTMKVEYHSRFPNHSDFANMLIDLNVFWKPQISLCDAVIGMEGNGPTAGTPRFIGALLASTSPYKLDLVASQIIGLSAAEIPTLAASIARGLTPDSTAGLSLSDDPMRYYIKDFKNIAAKKDVSFSNFGDTPIKKAAYKIASALTSSKPYTDTKQCIGCGKCADFCPEKTITIVNKKAKINRKKCIRCFCCQEFCPIGAMKVKRSFVGKILVK